MPPTLWRILRPLSAIACGLALGILVFGFPHVPSVPPRVRADASGWYIEDHVAGLARAQRVSVALQREQTRHAQFQTQQLERQARALERIAAALERPRGPARAPR